MNVFEDVENIFLEYFQNAKDVNIACSITKKQAKEGATKNLKLSRFEKCEDCMGIGKLDGVQCKECKGNGKKIKARNLIIHIPRKIKNNDRILVKEKGNWQEKQNNFSDLYINVNIYGDKKERKGKIVYINENQLYID